MWKVKTVSIILLLFICGPQLFFAGAFAAESDLVGQKAPMIVGKKAVGKGLLKLNQLTTEIDYKKDINGRYIKENGKYVLDVQKNIVVLNFFSKTCVPCIREIPLYNRLAASFENKPVRFIYVNVDEAVDKTEMKRMIARKQIKVPMMLPNQRDVIRKYNVISLPRIIVIDDKGFIQDVIVGFQEDLEQRLSQLINSLL